MSARIEIQDFLKTAQSRHVVESRRVFCVDGKLFQGFKGGPMPVEETQLTTDELKLVDDLDGTMKEVWFRICQRLESRYDNKSKEYGERRHKLRLERTAIRENMKEDKELGLDPSPADKQEIERIDKRMARLRDPELEVDYEYAKQMASGEEPKAAVSESPQVVCAECGAVPEPGHENPEGWLRGHKMGAHKNPRKKAAGE